MEQTRFSLLQKCIKLNTKYVSDLLSCLKKILKNLIAKYKVICVALGEIEQR